MRAAHTVREREGQDDRRADNHRQPSPNRKVFKHAPVLSLTKGQQDAEREVPSLCGFADEQSTSWSRNSPRPPACHATAGVTLSDNVAMYAIISLYWHSAALALALASIAWLHFPPRG